MEYALTVRNVVMIAVNLRFQYVHVLKMQTALVAKNVVMVHVRMMHFHVMTAQ